MLQEPWPRLSSIPQGVWVTLGFMVLYSSGAAIGIQGSDSSEFVLAASSSSRVHPPGYPILVMWLKSFQWLSDNPVWNSAVAVALLSAMSMGFACDALRKALGSRSVALWTTLMLGVQPLWLRYATIPEAFAILGLVYAILVWVSMTDVSRRAAVVLAVSLCIGIGSHHLVVCAFPLIIWNMWHLRRWWYVQFLGILLGLSSYAFLWVQNGGWGHIDSATALLRFFLRMDYGTFQITHHDELGTWWGTPLAYLKDWTVDSMGLFPLCVLLGLKGMDWRQLDAVFCVSWLLASVGVLSLFQLPTTHAYLVHSNRFFMAPGILILPAVANGVWRIYQRMQNYRVASILAWTMPSILLVLNAPVMGRFDQRIQNWMTYACRVLPEDALVFVGGDGAVFGLQLAQARLNQCTHVQLVFPKMLGYSWYRDQLADQNIYGHRMLEVITSQPATRPVFYVLVLSNQPSLPVSFPYAGVWMRFVSSDTDLPEPTMLFDQLQTFATHYPADQSIHLFLDSRTAERWPA